MHGCGCCSEQCERKNTCVLYSVNPFYHSIALIEDFYNFGIGSVTSNKSEVLWLCGPHGDWGMYTPLEEV